MKRIFITGASSGIGRGLAFEYARPNVKLGLLSRRGDVLEELCAELRKRGADAAPYPADVRDTDAVGEAARRFLAWAGGADLVIANAGIGERADGNRTDPRRVAEVMNVNVVGVTNTVLPFVEPMRRANAGTLVAISSVAGHRALPGSVSYSASKAAVITFMDGLRMELHGSGVHAMTICPGFVRTPLTDLNRYSMPFLLECEEACRIIRKAIERRANTFTFPWQMRGLTPVIKHAPEWVLRKAAPKGARSR